MFGVLQVPFDKLAVSPSGQHVPHDVTCEGSQQWPSGARTWLLAQAGTHWPLKFACP